MGVSPEGTALCYREIFRLAQRLGGDRPKPIVSIHNESLDDYLDAVLRDDWHAVGDLLTRSAQILATAGAEFCIVPDNLMQHGVHLAETRSPVPFLTMTDLVTKAVQTDQRACLGLIGTKLVMFGSTYQTTLGLAGVRVLIPEGEDADSLDSIIFDELLIGVAKSGSQRRVLDVIDRLKERGCDAVLMAVSESPLLVSQENCSLPVYDASMLLALGAVRRAFGLGDASDNTAPNASQGNGEKPA